MHKENSDVVTQAADPASEPPKAEMLPAPESRTLSRVPSQDVTSIHSSHI